MVIIHCIFNELLAGMSRGGSTHIRQFREDVHSNKSPMFPNGRAIVEKANDGNLIVKSSRGDIVAVSDDINIIEKRIKYADSSANVSVIHKGKSVTLDKYIASLEPIIYRIRYGISEVTGNIYVMDVIENGVYSEIMKFEHVEEVAEFIRYKQKYDEYYYIHVAWGRSLVVGAGGLDYYALNGKQADTERLSVALKEERAKRNSDLSRKERAKR